MIRLHTSNHTEALAAALADRVRAERQARGPLEPVTLVVPHRPMDTWLRHGLARAHGVAANLDVFFLRRFLAHVARKTAPDVRLCDGPVLTGLLLDLFHADAALADDALEPVRSYIHAAGDGADAIDRRRFQLAREIAHLFEEYALSRPRMLARWREGGRAGGGDTERWQQHLWLRLFGPEGLAAARGRTSSVRLLGPLEFFETYAERLALPPAIHVFGLPHVAPAVHRIFALLGARTDLVIYAPNPCLEFWEDVETDAELRRRKRFPRRAAAGRQLALAGSDDPFGLDDPRDTPALRLWGRPAREHVRFLNELSGCDAEPRFRDPTATGSSLLRAFQRDILRREPERTAPDGRLSVDGTIRFLAGPSPRRELEAVATEIWSLAEKDPTLCWSDVAVLLPEGGEGDYAAHLGAAFADASDLPYDFVGIPAPGAAPALEAALLCVALPLTPLTRPDVLRLATHPAVLRGFPGVRAEDWIDLAEALGIFRGADRADHQGTYVEEDLLSWDQGFRRLALGAFLGEPGAGTAPIFQPEAGGSSYLPLPVAPDALPHALALVRLARSLVADAVYARAARLPLRRWIPFLRALVGSVLPDGETEDVRDRIFAALAGLEDVDIGARPVGYRIAYELASAALAGVHTAAPTAQGGVVVSTIEAVRGLPFRAIFAVGLDEGRFPRTERPSALDLRESARQPGDLSRRELDRQLFLEALLAARDRFTLSFVSRDPVSGKGRQPSSVIVQLRRILEQGYVGPAAELVSRIPLERAEDAAFHRVSAGAAREAYGAAVGADLRQHLGGAPPPPDELRAALPPLARRTLETRLGWIEPPPAPAAAQALRPVAVTLVQLRRFLECPLQGSAKIHLGLGEDDDEDLLARDAEALADTYLGDLVFLREVLARTLREGPCEPARLAAVRAEAARVRELAGVGPTGFFGAAEAERHLEILGAWAAEIGGALGSGPGAVTHFGRARDPGPADRVVDPIALDVALADGRPVRVEIGGRTETRIEGTSIVAAKRRLDKKSFDQKNLKEALRGFLDHVVLSAAGLGGANDGVLVAVTDGEEHVHYRRRWPVLPPQGARTYLGILCRDILSSVHDYLLPCEAVFDSHTQGGSIVDEVQALKEDDSPFVKYSSLYGPVPRRHVESLSPPPETDARSMVARRFALFFDAEVGG